MLKKNPRVVRTEVTARLRLNLLAVIVPPDVCEGTDGEELNS